MNHSKPNKIIKKKQTKRRISWERLTWTRLNCHSIIVCVVVDFDWNTYEQFVVYGTNSGRLLCAVKMFALDDVVFHFKYMCKIHKRKVIKFGCIWVHQIQKKHTYKSCIVFQINRMMCYLWQYLILLLVFFIILLLSF